MFKSFLGIFEGRKFPERVFNSLVWNIIPRKPALIALNMAFGIFCLWIGLSVSGFQDTVPAHRVLTWNIRYDNPADGPDAWPRRREALAATLMAQDAGIIAVQEALYLQVAFLEERLPGYRRYGVGREDGARKGEFCPIWFLESRYVLLDSSTIWLSPTPDTPGKGWDAACERVASSVLLRDRISGKTLRVVNTHWDHVGSQARVYSARLLADMASRTIERGHGFILLGDLNVRPEDPCLEPWGTLLRDACPPQLSGEGTYNGFDPQPREWPRIDYIRVSSVMTVSGYAVTHPRVAGRWQSDHFPVVADVSAN